MTFSKSMRGSFCSREEWNMDLFFKVIALLMLLGWEDQKSTYKKRTHKKRDTMKGHRDE